MDGFVCVDVGADRPVGVEGMALILRYTISPKTGCWVWDGAITKGGYQDESGPIKIGYATDPIARLRGLQAGNPRELTFLGWFEAPARVERRLHSVLAPHLIRGEWFENCPEVVDALAECIEFFGAPECPRCEREARFIMAGLELPEPDGAHRCGRLNGRLR